MAYEIIWSEEAIEDINSIAEYLERDSFQYACSVVEKLYNAPIKLTDHPKAGKIVEELTDELIREITVYPYRLIYKIENMSVQIAAIIHGARNFEPVIKKRVI